MAEDGKQGFPIDTDTIRSRKQYEATVAATEAGCAWCLPDEEQKSPLLRRFELVDVRKNAFSKENRDMYLVILRRHAHMRDMTPEEGAAIFEALNWLIQERNLPGGGFIHRFGDPGLHASSLPDSHFFTSVVVPHGDVPVAETLVKDKSPEKQARREERAKTFTD